MQRVYSVCSPKPTNDQLALQETVFHNANGYLGVRGTLEEGAPQGMDTMETADEVSEEASQDERVEAPAAAPPTPRGPDWLSLIEGFHAAAQRYQTERLEKSAETDEKA